MRSPASRSLLALLLIPALGVTLALTSCSALSDRSDYEWDTARQMAKSSQSDMVPSLVASDAQDIRLSTAEVGSGPTVLAWRSTSGITRDDCKAGAVDGAPTDSVPGWWPKTVPAKGWACGWWRVVERSGTYYSWRQQDAQH